MGKNKTTKWFHSLLGSKKSPPESSPSPAPDAKENRKKSKWGLLKSSTSNTYKNEENPLTNPPVESLDANKHAIAVAAATAAVAEAALAAAKAAAEVVRLTSGSKTRNANASVYVTGERRRELAAIRIQSSFRAYLARRALRALKGLVKLQALVRGHIVRKHSSDMLHRMQAMARIQARASAHRAHTSDSTNLAIKYSNPLQPLQGVSNLQKNEQSSNSAKRDGPNQKIFGSRSNMCNVRTKSTWLGSNWLDRWMEEYTWNNQNSSFPQETRRRDDEIGDKILEIDTWKPRLHPKPSERAFQASQSQYFPVWNGNGQGSTTFDTLSKHSAKSGKPSPCIPSSSRRSPYSPTKSECSKSLFSEYLSHPSYMANTESSLAKFRSQSAPRPRMQYEELHMSTRHSRDIWDIDTNSEKASSVCTNYTNKAYPYPGQLNKPGTPIRGSAANFGSTYAYRHYK